MDESIVRVHALVITVLACSAVTVADEGCAIPDLKEPDILIGREALKGLPSDASSVTLDFPIMGALTENSQFGPRQLGSAGHRYDWHRGMDFSLPIGTTLYAPADAVVLHAGTHPNFSDTIVQLRHNSTPPYVYTLYLHLDSVLVSESQSVDAGDPIALSGQGSASYPHLHWEVRNSCLLQECCEMTYTWQSYGNAAPPSTPQLEAAGDLPDLGRILMFSTGVDKNEVDLIEFELQWGGMTLTANLNEMNSLSPSGQGSLLDDPLFFFEEHTRRYAILPERFNSTYVSADYNFLTWGLDGGVSNGTATATDAGGMSAAAALVVNLPPLTMSVSTQLAVLEPESNFAINYTITNNDSVPHNVVLEGISAQSLDLNVVPGSGSIAPGGMLNVTVSGQLGDWPEDIGDIVLLRAEVLSGSFTDLLGATLIDTDQSASLADWSKID